MAGIGVKLNHIYGKNTLTTNLAGMAYSTIVTIAPMIVVIVLTLEDQRQALLLLTAYFSLRDSLKHGCPFLFEELTKGAERT